MQEAHAKIIEVLQKKGPGLPIQIAREVGMSSLFISAFLSEMVGSKKVHVSAMKVGGSPLYYLQGQEEKLEAFKQYMHPKEAEAFMLLKNNLILKDSDQEPAIRVALRSIRDFAFSFSVNDHLYWRYFTLPEFEARNKIIVLPSIETTKEVIAPRVAVVETETSIPLVVEEVKKIKPSFENVTPALKKNISTSSEKKDVFENPLVIKEVEKPKKIKAKSEFVVQVITFLDTNNFDIIEEKEYKAKEYSCIVAVNSQLGTLQFLTQAKDKKSISDEDLRLLLSESQKIPLPALMLYTGEINKKGQAYLQQYTAILKAKKIE